MWPVGTHWKLKLITMCMWAIRELGAANTRRWFILFIIQQFDLLITQWFEKEEQRPSRIALPESLFVWCTRVQMLWLDKQHQQQHQRNTKLPYCFRSKYFLHELLTPWMHTKQSLSLGELFRFWYTCIISSSLPVVVILFRLFPKSRE